MYLYNLFQIYIYFRLNEFVIMRLICFKRVFLNSILRLAIAMNGDELTGKRTIFFYLFQMGKRYWDLLLAGLF